MPTNSNSNLSNYSPSNYCIQYHGSFAPVFHFQDSKKTYGLEKKLGAGAYATVFSFKKISGKGLKANLVYKTVEHLNADDRIKIPYDSDPLHVTLSTSQQEQLKQEQSTSVHTNSTPFTDAHLLQIGKETQHQMSIEMALRENIEAENIISRYYIYMESVRADMLKSLQSEAYYLTQYYSGTGKKAILLEGDPCIGISFQYSNYTATLHYHPGLALVIPNAPGIPLDTYSNMHYAPWFFWNHLFSLYWNMIEAVEYLHSLNIIHLDISPGNIMVDLQRNNAVTLIDFGMAKNIRRNDGLITWNECLPYNKPFTYWRHHRFRPSDSPVSYFIAGVEDDVYGTVMSIKSSIDAFKNYIEQPTLVDIFSTCLQQYANLLNKPQISLPNALFLLENLISLMEKLYQFSTVAISAQNVMEMHDDLQQAFVEFSILKDIFENNIKQTLYIQLNAIAEKINFLLNQQPSLQNLNIPTFFTHSRINGIYPPQNQYHFNNNS